jgi:molecular chaperone DnaK (HSP70)
MFDAGAHGSMTPLMETYEYKIQIYDKSSIMEAALSVPDHLTAQGRDGWRVVATIDGGHQIAFVMESTAAAW